VDVVLAATEHASSITTAAPRRKLLAAAYRGGGTEATIRQTTSGGSAMAGSTSARRSLGTGWLALLCGIGLAGCPPRVGPDGAAGSDGGGLPACSDGTDNDGDALVDFPADLGCVDGADQDESNPPACSDGLDNDVDGLVDYPGDPGCDSETDADETNPECVDGIDNDGDGRTDYPDDADCSAPMDPREAPDPQCSNGRDDNGDGTVDYPNDPGCLSADDDSESTAPPCLGGLPVQEITYTGMGTGSTTGASAAQGLCGGGAAPEAFLFLDVPSQLTTLSINSYGTVWPDVLYVQTTCGDSATELACATATTTPALVEMSNVTPGGYFIAVDGVGAADLGTYYVHAFGIIAAGQPCTPGDTVFRCDSSLNFDCAEPLPGAGYVCVAGLCSDGFDNDGDAITDWPLDPGCDDVVDNDEADPPTTPECYDGADNDGDGLTDYPADPGCEDTADDLELDQCVPGLLVQNLPTSGNVIDSTSGTSFLGSTCDASFMGSGPEDVWLLQVPAIANVTVSTEWPGTSFNTNLSLRDTCDDMSSEVACASTFVNGETITAAGLLPGSYFIIVDGQDLTAGSYELSAGGELLAGQPCDPSWVRFPCITTTACEPSAASPTGNACVLADCADGTDNDGDGHVDYPYDPGCINSSDGSETDACPAGPTCPACGDGMDNDADALIDYPADLGCGAAADDDEQGCLYNFTTGTSMGWTFTGTCGSGVAWNVWTGQSYSPTYALWYGNPATGNFDCGGLTNSGNATSTVITLPASGASVTFYVWGESEGCSTFGGYDRLRLDVDPMGPTAATTAWSRCDPPETSGGTLGAWVMQTVDLSAYNGMSVQLIWNFDTIDGIGNSGAGWYVDDIFVNGACP
jgi:hypothetical protein